MKFNLDHIEIELTLENKELRLITENENLLFHNQTVEEIKETIEKNYEIVKKHFLHKAGIVIPQVDLENFSLKIVLQYLYMYNHWRTMYKREKNRDLTFIPKDFKHPYTDYAIINYFKKKYPDNYANKCEILLDMNEEEFREYNERKNQFDNM